MNIFASTIQTTLTTSVAGPFIASCYTLKNLLLKYSVAFVLSFLKSSEETVSIHPETRQRKSGCLQDSSLKMEKCTSVLI